MTLHLCSQNARHNGSEGVQLKAAPLKVEQDIVLTLPEYAVCSLSGEDKYREADATSPPVIHGAGFKLWA